ncbi:MAG TPA: CHAT domain-containing protein [Allosphingosinicella sp.]|nr:CHAT domain-containing protein [Allosphingosinicella sp.]
MPGSVGDGAQAVIASLWAVADEAAAAFALRFYELYLDERGEEAMPPAEALARVQSWLREATVDTLSAGRYLSTDASEAIRKGRGSFRLRRSGGGEVAPVDAHGPFEQPTHWAGWILFGH